MVEWARRRTSPALGAGEGRAVLGDIEVGPCRIPRMCGGAFGWLLLAVGVILASLAKAGASVGAGTGELDGNNGHNNETMVIFYRLLLAIPVFGVGVRRGFCACCCDVAVLRSSSRACHDRFVSV